MFWGFFLICGYPQWAITSVQNNVALKHEKTKRKDKEEVKRWGIAVLPYVKVLTEKVARIRRKRGISTAMVPHTTLRRLLI